jgi:hypothetical protein
MTSRATREESRVCSSPDEELSTTAFMRGGL